MRLLFFLLLFFTIKGFAQEVPSKMTVAGVKLHFSDKLREELQKEVDALTVSPKYFGIKVDRAKIYFPIIEKIFAEEGVPDDIKYLVLQESALIPDAVSTSNAVGYWQFKDFTALEVGMRVDKQVDERMHIISATRGAAIYLKKNYTYFNNWIYAIQAYQMGAGGAMKVVNEKYYNSNSMHLDHNTYWYVKKFLAHKIAFESAVNGVANIRLDLYELTANKTLEQISKETSVSYDELISYNVWLRKGRIPDDKTYPVILPLPYGSAHSSALVLADKIEIKHDRQAIIPERVIKVEQKKFPVKDKHKPLFRSESVVTYNDIPGVMAEENQTLITLAAAGEVSLGKFLDYNDVDVTHQVKAGQVYYYKRKKAKAGTYYHVLGVEENLWDVSQKYGIRMRKLLNKNRLDSPEEAKPGLVLWLRYVRPENIPAEFKEIKAEVHIQEEKTQEKLQNEQILIEEAKEPLFEPSLNEESDSVLLNEDKIIVTPDSAKIVDVIITQDLDENITDTEENSSEPEDIGSSSTSIETLDSAMHYMQQHTVEAGETFYAIAKIYNVQVVEILGWNNLKINDKLSVGQQLKILQQKQQDDEKEVLNLQESILDITHEVKAGETLYQLSKKYNVTVEELMDWNSKDSFSIAPGERLLIKKVK